jgi:ABC-2 type transport system permease protein
MILFLRQLRFELVKLFGRKRTWLGFGAFLAVEVLILSLLQTPGAARALRRATTQGGMDFSHFYSGLTLAYLMISGTIFILGSLYLALVAGDVVAKEVEDGTMRMMLSRPVSRLRVLALKYAACVLYTWMLTLFIVSSSLLLALAFRGRGGLVVFAPMEHVFGFYEEGPGLYRYLLGTAMLLLVMPTISSIAFMFSCLNIKPASATICTLTVYIVDTVLRNIPYFEDLRGYFITYHMADWAQCFQQKLPWERLVHSGEYLILVDTVCVALGTLYFLRRDFKA